MTMHRLGRLLSGGKATGISGGAGVATYYIHKLAASKIGFVAKHPVVTPLALIAAGHLAKNKAPNVGAGIIGAGGYALGLAVDVQQQIKTQQAAGTAPAGTAALIEPADVRALIEPADVGAYEIPDAADDTGDLDYSSAMNLGL